MLNWFVRRSFTNEKVRSCPYVGRNTETRVCSDTHPPGPYSSDSGPYRMLCTTTSTSTDFSGDVCVGDVCVGDVRSTRRGNNLRREVLDDGGVEVPRTWLGRSSVVTVNDYLRFYTEYFVCTIRWGFIGTEETEFCEGKGTEEIPLYMLKWYCQRD